MKMNHSNSLFSRLLLLTSSLWLILATTVPAAVLEGTQPKKWPANPAQHQINIKRESTDAKQTALIAAAEAAKPDAEALKKAVGDGPVPKHASPWWYQETLGIRIPFALTGAAVTYYSTLIEGYKKQTFERFMEPSSKLDYHATVAFHAEFKLDGQSYKEVHVVTLKLTFTEHFAATSSEGMAFEKQRTVVLDAVGKVLAISGDGPTEVPVLAI